MSNHAFLAGDYWNVAVRESIHLQGDILLEDSNTAGGALPEGEHHHYMHLVNVDENGKMSLPVTSDCDKYKACQPPQFPSLTDLRADDICFDNSACELSDATTVQGAIDQLCKKNDLPWHNKHLHGWGIVCGLALECNKEAPSAITLKSGYALDCEGRDMIIENDIDIDVIDGLKRINLSPQLDENQGVCLYLDRTDNQLSVQFELYEDKQESLLDKLQDSLLFDFYNDCVVELIDSLKTELNNDQIQSKCLLTECGGKLIPVSKRTTLVLTNIAFHKNRDQAHSVLNVSSCEHQRLKNLYDRLQNILRSKTFCGQFTNNGFPDYPFKENCRSTWVTPGQLDHLRIHPKDHLLFGWKRNSPKVYVFEQSKQGCTGDLLAVMKAPVSTHTSITDLIIDSENNLYLSIIFNKRNSLIFKAQLNEKLIEDCNLLLEWQTRAINNFKIVKLQLSPWSRTNQLFAIALCKGLFLFNIVELFNNKIPINEVDWSFKASGHIAFDVKSDRVFATAYQNNDGTAEEQLSAVRSSINLSANTCENGYYNSIVYFDGKNTDNRRITRAYPIVNNSLVIGNDGIAIAPSTNLQPFPLTPDLSNPVEPALKIDARADFVSAQNYVLYIVGNEDNNKVLYRFNANDVEPLTDNLVQWFGIRYHPFGENDQISLKYLKKGKLNGVVASRYNHNDLQYIPNDPRQYDKDLLSSIPVQAGPVELINNDVKEQLFVLNHSSKSITSLNYELTKYNKQRVILKKYRDEVLNAYTQLLSSVLQYLKDCFCHKLLVECPECDEDDKVYLGCVTVKE